jgi:hypothetical protein
MARQKKPVRKVVMTEGKMMIDVPQDRKSTFEPQVVKKRQKDISDIDQKIISMYAKGMTTRQIPDTLEDIYGFEASESFISDVTDKIMPQIEDWQNRPLSEVYPVLYIDAKTYHVEFVGADIFPQGFSAVAYRLRDFKGINMLVDIGNGTMNIMYINDSKPSEKKCFTEKYGTHQCVLAVRESVLKQTGVVLFVIVIVISTGIRKISLAMYRK